MANFILSAFADEISPDFYEQLISLEKMDIYKLELRGVNGKSFTQLDDAEVMKVRSMLVSSDVTLSALGSPLGKVKCDCDMKEHLALAERVMDIGETLSCNRIRMFSFYKGENMTDDEFEKRAFDCVEQLLDIADRRGFVLCHENEKDIYGETPEKELKMLKHFGGKLRAVLDPGNFVYCGVDGSKAPEMLSDYITYCHIKDSDAPGSIVPPGEGKADIKGVLSTLNKKHRGDMILTVEPHLTDFVGLSSLAADGIKHRYSFKTPYHAFSLAVGAVRLMLTQI